MNHIAYMQLLRYLKDDMDKWRAMAKAARDKADARVCTALADHAGDISLLILAGEFDEETP